MKRIPFPLPLNIGTDIVHIPRITRLITSSNKLGKNLYLDKFTRRILSNEEREQFHARFPTHSSSSSPELSSECSRQGPGKTKTALEMARWLAGRFAAKEAARKAAPGGASAVSWKDVMVSIEDGGGGRPEVLYVRDDGEGGRMGEVEVGKLSISHDGEYVVAMVVAGA